MILIIRRKWAQGGTRFNARGIDDEGNVANQCESEFLVFKHYILDTPQKVNDGESVISTTEIFSHVQVRGSMPFFWEQSGVKTIQISRPLETTIPAFKLHFDDLRQTFNDGQVFSLNLVTPNSSMERLLLESYEKLLNKSGYKKE